MMHKENSLLVHYEDLIKNPRNEIARIEEYWDLAYSNISSLLYRKYTRFGENSIVYHEKTKSLWRNIGREKK